ncbi:MAG: Ig-like domain-containing protein [Patescibacteria group bacterium]
MFWKKVYHHASFIFLAILLFAQCLVLVATQARPKASYDLAAIFIEPMPYTSLAIGDSVSLQARLSSKAANNFSSVYFIVANADKNISLNFEASKQVDGSWLADSTWQTTDWPGAIYQISVTANITDANGQLIDSLNSAPQLVQLVDMGTGESVLPAKTSSVSTSTQAAADESMPLPTKTNQTTSTPPDTSSDNSPSSDASTPTSTSPTSTTTPSDSDKNIILLSPASGSIISDSQLSVKLTTNFEADVVSVELINTNNAAISTGSIDINKVDGLSWDKTLTLGNTFIDGDYKLLVSADPKDDMASIEKAFDFMLALTGADTENQDLAISLLNIGSNLSGSVTLRAMATANANSAGFLITNSLTDAEVLLAAGVRKASTASTSSEYLYIWDTKTAANGNYFIQALAYAGGNTVKSEKKLISVFNETTGNEEIVSSTQEIEGEPTDIPTPEEPISEPSDSGLDCAKSGIADQIACAKFMAELSGVFPSACLKAGVYDAEACEQFLNQSLSVECQEQGITDAEKCKDYLMQKYASQVVCQLTATSTCADLLRDDYLNRLAAIIKQRDFLSSATAAVLNQTLSVTDLNQKLKESGLSEDLSTLATPELKVMVVKAQAETILAADDKLEITPPAILLPDNDSDMLPNDLEKYYGTDLNNADTDNDGYKDGEEVKNAYNPLGQGKLATVRTVLDQIILSNLSLEQPKSSSGLLLDTNWQVMAADSQNGNLALSGQADPETWVNIYLYSGLPILLTTRTDASGKWTYDLPANLSEGVHQAYVAINDASGKIIKQSAALIFSVTNLSAPAASAQVTFTDESPVKPSFQFVWWYFILAGVAVLIVALVIISVARHRRQEAFLSSSQPIAGAVDSRVNTQTMPSTPPSDTPTGFPQ